MEPTATNVFVGVKQLDSKLVNLFYIVLKQWFCMGVKPCLSR
jgi:hypothetical protein